jgi:hypothetical protein
MRRQQPFESSAPPAQQSERSAHVALGASQRVDGER